MTKQVETILNKIAAAAIDFETNIVIEMDQNTLNLVCAHSQLGRLQERGGVIVAINKTAKENGLIDVDFTIDFCNPF